MPAASNRMEASIDADEMLIGSDIEEACECVTRRRDGNAESKNIVNTVLCTVVMLVPGTIVIC
jgi:hypothetical protein